MVPARWAGNHVKTAISRVHKIPDREKRLHVSTSFLYICGVQSRTNSSGGALFERVDEQQGYFTAKQAADAGYLLGSQAHHVKAGNWVRVHRGIYRLARFPQSADEQLVIYSLWSRNRAGEPEGVYSHQTALSIHEMSDINPSKLHITVPPAFRRSAKVPKVVALHYAALGENDVEQRHGFRVTRPFRAIADLAAAEEASRDIITQALAEARSRGLVTAKEIVDMRRKGKHAAWFDKLLSQHAK